jgi:mRNA interferase MazF
MAITTRVAVSIPKTLYDQAEILARRLAISRKQLYATALGDFVASHQSRVLPDATDHGHENFPDPDHSAGAPGLDAESPAGMSGGRRKIRQGDIYWVPLEEDDGVEPGYTHPQVVIQDDVFNRSRLDTVVVCALTTNMKRAKAPGNVLLEAGEANLPKRSVVVVSQVSAVDITQLDEYIGSLSRQRIDQILLGMQFLHRMMEPRSVPGSDPFRFASPS